MDEIFDIIDEALAKAGYKVLEGDNNAVIIRDAASDTDYQV